MRRLSRRGGGASTGKLRRRALVGVLGAVVVGLAAFGAVSLGSAGAGTADAARTIAATHTAKTARTHVRRHRAVQPAIVAKAVRRVSVYRIPGARRAFAHYGKRNPWGQPRVFLVAQRLGGWDRVYLPRRPNGVTGWVRSRQVSLATDPYRVVVSLRRHRVTVYKLGRRILTTKAGVGRSVLPTPRGTYFLVELAKQPDPAGAYGPYAFGTSAFSNVLYHFGGGPGEIGLHGTDYPAGLGHNISHGCIRIANWAIRRLAHILPLGTPVTIAK